MHKFVNVDIFIYVFILFNIIIIYRKNVEEMWAYQFAFIVCFSIYLF